ncbi:MAG: polysaccharide pyruvyl transferase family protein, partial [Desulfopila sp.]|nr:polysaccharide pyruvyl transferase family protein [Desulfopila sp.]
MESLLEKTAITEKTQESRHTIEQVSHNSCCGCGACFNVCPHNAIAMKNDRDGFLFPQVDKNNCISCGSCYQTCPVLDPVSSNAVDPSCYAVWAEDDIRQKSSSGGAFSLLAEYVLERDGVVCGAAFDENWQVQHVIIDNQHDLEILRGSKYVQSDTSDIYKKIRKILQTGKLVLFSGCPCQVAGLQKFLRGKYSRSCITVDIFCHSIASPGIWQKYLSDRFHVENIDTINFRDKDITGWSCRKCTVSINGKKLSSEEYVRGFHRGLYARTCCENCKFSSLPRFGDFTLGDWWGINAFNPEFNDDKGTSLLLVNNESRQDIVQEIKQKALLFKEVPLKYIGKNGHIYGSLQLPPKRPVFFDMLRRGVPFTKALTAVLDEQYDFGVIGFWYGMNYGSMLTSLALYKTLLNLGHTAVLINKPHDLWGPRYSNTISMPNRFFRSNCLVSDRDSNFYKLNDNCAAFIVGSDTVWNPVLVNKHLPFFFLDFAAEEKNKISYASSFGRNHYKVDDPLLRQYSRYSCRRLDHISVREDIGLDILKDEFGKNGTRVLDPVFLIEAEEYRALTEAGPDMKEKDKFIFSYILGADREKITAYRRILDSLKLPAVNFPNPNMLPEARKTHPLEIIKDDSLENWLYGIDNAHLVVADSFHAVCFSLILR